MFSYTAKWGISLYSTTIDCTSTETQRENHTTIDFSLRVSRVLTDGPEILRFRSFILDYQISLRFELCLP
jgi:hypothetical protein